MARQGMKKEGAVGLILIAIIIVVAVLAFRPKGLEAALGGGFDNLVIRPGETVEDCTMAAFARRVLEREAEMAASDKQ